MDDKPELIAKLRIGVGMSGECSKCHEVFVVAGKYGGDHEATYLKLKKVFEDHLKGRYDFSPAQGTSTALAIK